MRFTVLSEPRADAYRELLTEGAKYCEEAMLVQRSSLGSSHRLEDFLFRLKSHVTWSGSVSEWPGTVLFDETATAFRFAYGKHTRDLLLAETSGLYEWQQPELPEDLCLIAGDGRPWLVTIAHERDAYLDIPEAKVPGVLPTLKLIKVVAEAVPVRG